METRSQLQHLLAVDHLVGLEGLVGSETDGESVGWGCNFIVKGGSDNSRRQKSLTSVRLGSTHSTCTGILWGFSLERTEDRGEQSLIATTVSSEIHLDIDVIRFLEQLAYSNAVSTGILGTGGKRR